MTENKQIIERNGYYCIEPCIEIKELRKQLTRKTQELKQAEQKLQKIEAKCNETLELMDRDSGTNAYAGGRCTEAGNILKIIDEVE